VAGSSVEILKRFERLPEKHRLKHVVEGITNLDIGIDTRVSFGPGKHQGLDKIYYTTVRNGRVVPVTAWDVWRK
jgi:hypothetical protein